jgi:hypothetical protein
MNKLYPILSKQNKQGTLKLFAVIALYNLWWKEVLDKISNATCNGHSMFTMQCIKHRKLAKVVLDVQNPCIVAT